MGAFCFTVKMWCVLILFVFVSVDSSVLNVDEIAQNYSSTNPCTDQNHLFLVPGAVTAGSNSRACLSRFHPEGPALVTLTLRAEGQETTATRKLLPGDGGCLDLPVPMLPNTKAELLVSVRYPESRCTWTHSVTIRISSGRLIVLLTERARYRPGDTLRVRAIVLKADLSPVHGSIDEMWLEGPRGAWTGARAASWSSVRTRLGLGQAQYELDTHAPPGRWTVRAMLADGSQGASDFWVGNYEIPPFQLTVRHAAKVLRSSERLVWTVCVRYPWTEAVEGMLVIRLRGAGGNFNTDGTPGVRTAVRLRTPKACHRHAIAARRIGLDGATPPDVVVADFSFQEDGTRVWQNTTVVSQVVDKPVTLEFLTKHRAVIAPGLPYKLKIKATRWDDRPASNEHVHVCRSPASIAVTSAITCDDAVTDARGVARVIFTVDDHRSLLYKFQATLLNDSSAAAPPLYLPIRHTGNVHAALGPLRSFVPLYLSSKDIDTALTVHFVVITRGGTIYRWGATTQCPVSSTTNQIYTAPRNSRCNQDSLRANSLAEPISNTSDSLLDRHLLRIMLPIKVTHQMCPDSHLIAYFYYKGEMVSASKHIEMEECFANKVEASWLSRQVAPGASASLSVTTHGLALCGLSVVDPAAHVQPAPNLKDIILDRLKRLIEGHRNLTEYDAAGECFLTTDSTELPTTSLGLTTSWLASAGVRAAGGAPAPRRCADAPAPLLADDVMSPRSDFSEAWLWRLLAVGVNGSAVMAARAPDSITRFDASAICVARNGISVAAPAVLQVFREFFIHADGPRRLRRGDAAVIRYRIFNYLYEPLSIDIQVFTDPHLKAPRDYVETACVGARSSAARRVQLRAALPGGARVAIRAKAVRDASCGGRTGISDEIIIQIQVDPEGVPVQDHQSALLCSRGSRESSSSEVRWSWPEVQAVPGTEAVTVWATGDITGPLLADADSLVLLPRGCGEQNMARLATNLLALKQLDPQCAAAAAAKEHVARGLTRQLQYTHPSGGFSAFGAADEPSTWLTAFAIRYLRKAHEVLYPGMPAPPAIDRAERWLLDQQMENGCFRNEGQVFHRELKGGLNEDGEIANVALAAYVITSLVESSSNLPYKVVRNSLSCLRALPPLKAKSPTRVYAHALLAYAFMRLRKYEEDLRRTNEASPWESEGRLEDDEDMRELLEMMRMSQRREELVWWETSSLSTSIEATGYALLAMSSCPTKLRAPCAYDARGATLWLSKHRSSGGGFVATQDTLVALEALTAWTASQPPAPTHLNVTVNSGDSARSTILTPAVKIPEVMKMGLGPLTVSVEGSGCALVQATRSYNTLAPAASDRTLTVQVSVRTDGPFDCAGNQTDCFCAAVVEACLLWSGEFPEMALLDITLPGGFGADASLLYAQLQQPDTLLRRIELSANAGRATLYLASRGTRGTHRCFTVHAVGPAASTKPAHVRVQDYYVPAHNDTQMYTIPEDCPARVSHRSKDYLRSDNLFNKARSDNNGDIIITDEFSFEDIPEGIPLEDPLFENLTQIDKKNSSNDNSEQDVIGDLQREPDADSNTNNDTEVTRDKLESENEIIKIDDKIDHNFGTGEDEKHDAKRTVKLDEVIDDMKNDTAEVTISTEVAPIFKNTEQDAKETEVTEHKIEIRDETRQEEDQGAGVDNPKLTSFHVIDSEKDLDVPTGVEGPVPAVVLPPPNFVSLPPYTGPMSAALPSIQANPKAFHNYPPYQYFVYTELPRYRYSYRKR